MRAMNSGRALLLAVCLTSLCRGAIRLQSPNGGESFSAQSTQLITWQCDTSITQVVIEFSYTDGVLWETIAPAARCANGWGSYSWQVPAVSSPRCLIRITAVSKSGDRDQSDGVFTVFPCALRMDYDGDCAVTFADFAAFAQEWLRCGDPYDPQCLGNSPPRIVSLPPTQASFEQGFTYTVRAADPDGGPLTYALLQAPSGMAIDPASGTITWIPGAGQADARAVVVQVRDEFGAADVQAFALEPDSPQVQHLFTGAPVNGYPNLFERRVLVYTNAVRMAPQQYRDRYMAGYDPDPSNIMQSNSPAEPLYYEPALNRSARAHALDMAENGCFDHDSCDGTPWSDRIWGFYPQARAIGENIAAGYRTAKDVVDAWLCDETGGQCAADGSYQAGHRTNMLDTDLNLIGIGYMPDAFSNWGGGYWVQDLASNNPATKPPIVAACHDFLLAGKTSFLLDYRDTTGRAPASVQVVLGGVSYDMALDLGSAAAGMYRVDLPKGTTCREYYFLATTGGGESWRCPGPGVFLTDGEAACGADYR